MHIRGFMLFALNLSGFVIFGGCNLNNFPISCAIAFRILPTGTARPAARHNQHATSGILTLREYT